MNQYLLLLLSKHFNWTTDFSVQFTNIFEAHPQLEYALQNLEHHCSLHPGQLSALIEKQKLDSFSYCFKYFYAQKFISTSPIKESIEPIYQLHMQNLLNCGFTENQFINFNPLVYQNYDLFYLIEEQLLYVEKIHRLIMLKSIVNHTNNFYKPKPASIRHSAS